MQAPLQSPDIAGVVITAIFTSILPYSITPFVAASILKEKRQNYGIAFVISLITLIAEYITLTLLRVDWWLANVCVFLLLWALFMVLCRLQAKEGLAAALTCLLTLWMVPMEAVSWGWFFIAMGATPGLVGAYFFLHNREVVFLYQIGKRLVFIFGPFVLGTAVVLSPIGWGLALDLPVLWYLPFSVFYYLAIINLNVCALFGLFMVKHFGRGWLLRQEFKGNQIFGPYIFYGTDPTTSMTIAWGKQLNGKNPNDNKRVVLLGTNLSNLKPRPESIRQTDIVEYCRLEGLNPGTQYYYQVPAKSTTFSFQTAPRQDNFHNNANFECAFISDLHAAQRDVRETVNLLQSLGPGLQFILSGGDNVSDARVRRHWQTFWGQFEPISPYLPFVSAPGNHDGQLHAHARGWANIFPYPYPQPEHGHFFKVIFLNAAFFLLDNYNAGKTISVPSPEQLQWLTRELANLPPEISHRVIIFHVPIYTTGASGCDPKLENVLTPLIDQYHVELVIAGHAHLLEIYSRDDINRPTGTTFIVAGGGGGYLESKAGAVLWGMRYHWEGGAQVTQNRIVPRRITIPRSMDDYAVTHYLKFGKVVHHVVHFRVEGTRLTLRVIGWGNSLLYQKEIHP